MSGVRKRGWLLTDGAPGHESQSRGIADAIARFTPIDVDVVMLRVRHRFLKSIGRVLLKIARADGLLERVYDVALPGGRPDFVISSGGNTLLASALLARRHGVPNFYSGTLKDYEPAWFARTFSVTPQPGQGNVVLPLPPVPGVLCVPLPAPVADAPVALLLGGDGGGLHYCEDDWCTLAEHINTISRATGRRWLLTSSRRTGSRAEDLLARFIDPLHIVEAVWWSRDPRKVVREFLARAAAVYVTGDSLTMVAEAIYSGRAVTVLEPRDSHHEPQDAEALARYGAAGFVRVESIGAMAAPAAAIAGVAPVAMPDVQSLVWQAVREYF